MKKRMLIAMATIVAFAALMLGSAVPAFAEETTDVDHSWGYTTYEGKLTVYNTTYLQERHHRDNSLVTCNEKARIIKVTSSNPKVAKVYKVSGKYTGDFLYGDSSDFVTRGVGKTTIVTTISYKGRTYTSKLRLTVKKWVNPLMTLKIGSKSYKAKFKETNVFYAKRAFSKKKLTVKAATNWKVTKIRGFFVTKTNPLNAKLKSGSKVSFKASLPQAYIEITCKNKKNGNVAVVKLKNEMVAG